MKKKQVIPLSTTFKGQEQSISNIWNRQIINKLKTQATFWCNTTIWRDWWNRNTETKRKSDVLICFEYAGYHPVWEKSIDDLLIMRYRFGVCLGDHIDYIKHRQKNSPECYYTSPLKYFLHWFLWRRSIRSKLWTKVW